MGFGEAICLRSGRGGCDAQVATVMRGIGLTVVDDLTESRLRPTIVATTGPERAGEALALARALDVPAVGFGQPGRHAAGMDLVVTTPQFDVPGTNVLRLPFAITPHGSCARGAFGEDAHELAILPRPLGLLLVGGDAGPWRQDVRFMLDALRTVVSRNASVVVLTSARTSPEIRRMLAMLDGPRLAVDSIDGLGIRMVAAIHACDEAFVTGDSVSMISEAAAAGRPVGVLIPPAEHAEIEAYLRRAAADPNGHAMPGDLRRFWASLGEDVANPTRHPSAGGANGLAEQAIAALLEHRGVLRAA